VTFLPLIEIVLPKSNLIISKNDKSVRRRLGMTQVELALMRIFKQILCIISLFDDFSGGTPALTLHVHAGKHDFSCSEQTATWLLMSQAVSSAFSC